MVSPVHCTEEALSKCLQNESLDAEIHALVCHGNVSWIWRYIEDVGRIYGVGGLSRQEVSLKEVKVALLTGVGKRDGESSDGMLDCLGKS